MYVCGYDDGGINHAIQEMYDQQPIRAQYLIDIGWNKRSKNPYQELVTATDIPQSWRDEYREIQNAMNDLIGGYPYYLELMYTTDEFSQNVLDKLKEVNFGGDEPVTSVDELEERGGCLTGSSIEIDSLGREVLYSLCIQQYPFMEGWDIDNKDFFTNENKYRLWLYHGWIHEYFHHYQGRSGLGKNGDMDQHNSVRAPKWWTEGSAVIFPSLWLNKNWYKLDKFKEYTPSDPSNHPDWTWGSSSVEEITNLNKWFFENVTEARGETGQCNKDHYFGPNEEYYGKPPSCWHGLANAYLAYLTSYQTIWVDIPRDYYALGFEGSFEKHTGMTLSEFYEQFNAFLRQTDPNNPPEGFFPDGDIKSFVDFGAINQE